MIVFPDDLFQVIFHICKIGHNEILVDVKAIYCLQADFRDDPDSTDTAYGGAEKVLVRRYVVRYAFAVDDPQAHDHFAYPTPVLAGAVNVGCQDTADALRVV